MKSLCLLFVFVCICCGVLLPSIPQHLQPCYRNGGAYLGAPHRLDVFLSLIRKLEHNTSLDLRLFSTALLRSLRLDGIEEAANSIETEFLLPFRASAFQFHKYKLLMDIFLPSQDLIDVDELLHLEEKCLLHTLISSTVQPWERGDENIVCPLSAEQQQSISIESRTRLLSRCPIEDGVVQTEWGAIAAGTLIAAIASSLEAQRVSVTDILQANVFKEDIPESIINTALKEWDEKLERLNEFDDQTATSNIDISNTWAATLAGDLAEVVVNQGPRVGAAVQHLTIGTNNRWNDTLLPRHYYLFQHNNITDWHMTDAEILTGIDGLILAHHVPGWVEQRRSLRLSQIIEMYYTNEGVSFDPRVKACNRHALLSDIVTSQQLSVEASRLAHILSLRQITVYIPVEELNRITESAVTVLMSYLPTLLRQNHKDCRASRSIPTMDLVVATDSSWNGYEVEQFMSWIGGALEINLQKSTLGLLHGNTGEFIAQPSNNLTNLFTALHNFTSQWPNRLNLPNVISSVTQHIRNATLKDIRDMRSAGPSTVVLIVSPTDRMSSVELERSRTIMNSLRSSFFDVYFAYVAQDVAEYKNINNEYMDYSELFITVPTKDIADVIAAVDNHLVNNVIPSRIMGAQCSFNDTDFPQIPYEDYVLPGREQAYRIHPFYMKQQALVSLQFRNDGHGRILVCLWRGAETSHTCQAMNERDIHIFNLTNPCASPDFCPPANVLVTALTTQNLCAHNDCRLPHQVGFYIQHSGFRCLPLLGSAAAVSPIWKVLRLSLVISLLLLF
ncbi:uncharacterized protein LOC126966310 [Leptidea sinapis]|uniref:uncharacterized protein LOC126966310 n=1 Tax=Leptidea sinapis TaxID=189913 RepID=UPI00211F4D35|nr:uncharacterized protein LOC126966310 [Leptidea sinapis]